MGRWREEERRKGGCGGVQVRTWPDPPVATLRKVLLTLLLQLANVLAPTSFRQQSKNVDGHFVRKPRPIAKIKTVLEYAELVDFS